MSTHNIHLQKKEEENLPKLSVHCIWRKSLRTRECVRLIHGIESSGFKPLKFSCIFSLTKLSVYIIFTQSIETGQSKQISHSFSTFLDT